MDKKIEILEDALGRLDPELVEKTQKVPEKKPGHSIWQAILLAAALLLLIGVGFFLKDHIQVPGHKKTQEESEKRTKSALNPGQTGNYSVALAKYPELPEALDLKLIMRRWKQSWAAGIPQSMRTRPS